MKRKRRSHDRIAFALMLASLFSFGVIYGIFAAFGGWAPVPQLRAGLQAWHLVRGDLRKDWIVDLPGRRPEIVAPVPDRLAPGLLMIAGVTDGPRNFVRIVDRAGTIVHEWHPDWFRIWGDTEDFPAPDELLPRSQPGAVVHGAAMAPNGDVILNLEGLSTMRLSPCGEVVWKLDNLGHHSVHIDDDGMIWAGVHTYYEDDPTPFANHKAPLYSSTIQKISPNGRIVESIEVLDVLRKNDLLGLMHMSATNDTETVVTDDTMHLNDVETYPSDRGSALFDPGDIMISLRNINTVMVIDPETHRIKFRSTGRFLRQHDPDFIGGDGILVFDNRNLSPSTGPEEGTSRIMQIDAATGRASVHFQGDGDSAFYTDIMGKQQYLENGNLLITASREGRVFEVAPDGTLLWEYNNVVADGRNGLFTQAEILPPDMDRQFFERLSVDCVH